MISVGCFELAELSPGRWSVVNTLTRIAFVTYGTETELVAEYTKQSKVWEAKYVERRKGCRGYYVGAKAGRDAIKAQEMRRTGRRVAA